MQDLEINRAVFRSPKRAIFGFGFGGKIHGPHLHATLVIYACYYAQLHCASAYTVHHMRLRNSLDRSLAWCMCTQCIVLMVLVTEFYGIK